MTNSELDWAEELVKDFDFEDVKWFLLSNGKKFKYTAERNKSTPWSHTSGWDGWYIVDSVSLINNELCFLTSFDNDFESDKESTYYVPISDYSSVELSFENKRPIN
jgi:hypothetical protein